MRTDAAPLTQLQHHIDLPTIRRRLGISLAQISQATKISLRYLQAIEEGDFGKLPGGLYDTSYIRQYARAIRCDERELLANYYASMNLERAAQLPFRNLENLPIKPDSAGTILPGYLPGSSPASEPKEKACMTKADLIEEVARDIEVTRKDSCRIVEAILNSIARTLRNGEKIEIRGFGVFRHRQRQARVNRNPKTGARVEVPPKRVAYFKPSKELKELVNNPAEVQVSTPPPAARETAS